MVSCMEIRMTIMMFQAWVLQLEFHRTHTQYNEHCQWTVLYREFSNVSSMNYCCDWLSQLHFRSHQLVVDITINLSSLKFQHSEHMCTILTTVLRHHALGATPHNIVLDPPVSSVTYWSYMLCCSIIKALKCWCLGGGRSLLHMHSWMHYHTAWMHASNNHTCSNSMQPSCSLQLSVLKQNSTLQ